VEAKLDVKKTQKVSNKDEIIFKLKDLFDDMNARKAEQPEKAQDYFEGFDKGYGSSPSS
jgi:hypothetical protein